MHLQILPVNSCTNSGFQKLLKDLAAYEIFGASETFLAYKSIPATPPEVVRLKQMDAVMHYRSYYAKDAPQTELVNTINVSSECGIWSPLELHAPENNKDNCMLHDPGPNLVSLKQKRLAMEGWY